jgi:hypothetical protein
VLSRAYCIILWFPCVPDPIPPLSFPRDRSSVQNNYPVIFSKMLIKQEGISFV